MQTNMNNYSSVNEIKYEFINVKSLVNEILTYEIRARNDDKYLTLRTLQHFVPMYIDYNKLKDMPTFYTPQRLRQIIQHKEGKWLPTDYDIYKKRFERANIIKNIINEI
jgi:hypothetical protein